MNQKQIGIFIIFLGVLLVMLTFNSKIRDDHNIDLIIEVQNGSCYLEDGTCLHQDRNYFPYIFGWVLSVSMIILGAYLIFFDKTQEIVKKQHEAFTKELSESKATREFEAFLSGFEPDEKKVLKIIHEQEGIKQSTLRFKADISKTALSLMLKKLEDKKIIKRKKSGKTNEIYLIKKY